MDPTRQKAVTMFSEEYMVMVLAALEELAAEATGEQDPGPWTARLCRYINNLPETQTSVIYCGLCAHYANPRKRARAARLPPTLPGFTEGGYQLHATCRKMPFSMLKHLLYRMEARGIVRSEPGTRIPDGRNYRGWDFATVWRMID